MNPEPQSFQANVHNMDGHIIEPPKTYPKFGVRNCLGGRTSRFSRDFYREQWIKVKLSLPIRLWRSESFSGQLCVAAVRTLWIQWNFSRFSLNRFSCSCHWTRVLQSLRIRAEIRNLPKSAEPLFTTFIRLFGHLAFTSAIAKISWVEFGQLADQNLLWRANSSLLGRFLAWKYYQTGQFRCSVR